MDLAQSFCDIYYNSHPIDRFRFLSFLSNEYSTTIECVSEATSSFLQAYQRVELYDAALLVDRLQKRIHPKYFELFKWISRLNFGVKFLVDMRSDLISALSNSELMDQMTSLNKIYIRLLSSNLGELLSLCFTAGFLQLKRITWDSPASLLQKVVIKI